MKPDYQHRLEAVKNFFKQTTDSFFNTPEIVLKIAEIEAEEKEREETEK